MNKRLGFDRLENVDIDPYPKVETLICKVGIVRHQESDDERPPSDQPLVQLDVLLT